MDVNAVTPRTPMKETPTLVMRNEIQTPWRPNAAQLQAAKAKLVPDLIAPNLKVLFCGINPGLYTAAVGHHFARPGNRFWKVLHLSRFTSRQLTAFEEKELLKAGYGITNVVGRATATAAELTPEEFIQGGKHLEAKLQKYKPKVFAVLGIGAYRTAFNHPEAVVGRQERRIAGVEVWALPNPSGLNAHYQLDALVKLFKTLRQAVS